MSDSPLEEVGPIDFVLIEFPETGLGDDSAQAMLDLVDRGIIRVLDFLLLQQDAGGTTTAQPLGSLDPSVVGAFAAFEGATSGLLGDDDVAEAGNAMEPSTLAVLIVFENVWAAAFGAAARKAGGQLIAFDRIPVQAVIAALDALDTAG
jgi:hypothetical protein